MSYCYIHVEQNQNTECIQNMKIRSLVSLITTSALILTTGCSSLSKEPLSYTGTAFDTVINIQIFDSNEQELIENCKTICQNYEEKFSRTIDTSEISKINAAGGAPVEVSDETIQIINKGIYYGEMSNGAFDITIGSLTSLWGFSDENASVPTSESISDALKHVDYKNIVINDNYVQLLDPDAKLDLGGIAKGYIADCLKEYLEQEGVDHALINLGGNILAVGNKLDKSDFNIGIQNPKNKDGEPITTVTLNDQSVVTSGNYQRYFEQNGEKYHHLLDPKTGYPSNNGLNSVTIITNSSLTADALSTTCFVLGPERGMKLVNQLDNVEAVFIDSNNKITYSRNFSH